MQPQGAERLAAVAAAVAVVASWSVRAAVRYGSAAVSNLIRRNAVIKQRDRHPSLPTYWRFAALLALMPGLALAQPVPLQGVIAVDAGGGHTCAALSDGGARCWGYNFLAQVGDGSRTDRLLPVRVVDLNDPLAALGLGESHSCALTQGGVVRCWGMNVYGQLGDGTTDLGLRPVTARNLGTGVLQVGGGENNSCALTAQHGVKCWGANYSGQLGDGTTTDRLLAVDVVGLTGGVRSIAVGHRHTCAVTDAGGVKCWGFNFAGQLGDGQNEDRSTPVDAQGLRSGIVQVAAGLRHTCALSGSGAVSCWGDNSYLQLGSDVDENGTSVPTPVIGLGEAAIALDLGNHHSCALMASRRVLCWGRNDLGQLGDGSIIRSNRPVAVQGLLADVQSIGIGQDHGCARQADGSLRCWGLNFSGSLGNGTTTQSFVAQRTQGLSASQQSVDVGEEHSCSLSDTGGVQCWGLNLFNQLGDGTILQRLVPGPVLDLGSQVTALDAGGFHSCAIRNGAVLCWGRNDVGQIGDGSFADQQRPVPVIGLDSGVQAVSAGGVHSCALRNGSVSCWGNNYAGQLGDGSTDPRQQPVAVAGLSSGVTALATSIAAHSCAINASGGLKCWGANERGQLGDGSTVDRSTPVDVVGLGSGVRAVALGGEHSCALLNSGGVRCWGSNDNFQLGNDSGAQSNTSIAVTGLSGATALALGRSHSCALLAGGRVACWGRNDFGQVGDGSSLQLSAPTTVSGLGRGARAIAAAAQHSCAALIGGGVKCWGSNYSGQFGNGTFGGEPVPVDVLVDNDKRLAAVPQGDAAIEAPASNASGQYLVFQSRADGLVPGDSNQSVDIFRVDTFDGSIERVSLDDSEAQISGDSAEATISGDGQRVIFVAPDAAVTKLYSESAKRSAARRKGGSFGLFLRNMLTGTTQRVGDAMSSGSAPQFAADGLSVVYGAINTDPTKGPVGTQQVFLQPLSDQDDPQPLGFTRCVSCKSVNADGSESATNSNGEASQPVVSGDGTWVAWQTTASNAMVGASPACPNAASQIVLRNMITGVVQTLSNPSGGDCSGGSSGSELPSIDFNGEGLVFQSDVALGGEDDNQDVDVYHVNLGTGALTRVSQTLTGISGNGASGNAVISGDGGTVVFSSEARNLVPGEADNNAVADVYAFNLGSGVMQRVSNNALGDQADAPSSLPVLNHAGSLVSFESTASNLLLGTSVGTIDSNGLKDLYQTVNPVAAAPLKSATWWKQSESGWGLFVFDQGNLLAPAWFTYDIDGEPTWFLAAGAFPQPDGSYGGELFRFTGVPFDQIDGPAADEPTLVGNVNLVFRSEQSLQFNYSVDGVAQSKDLTRFPFGTRTVVCRASADPTRRNADNYSDVWWGGAATTGWGLFMNHVDDGLFAVWYTYDSDGEALFMVIVTARQPDGSFAGEVYRQANGTPFSMINDMQPSPNAITVGTAQFRFDDGATGEFRFTIGSATRAYPIERFQVGALATVCETAPAP
ncbi:MAG: hypothetical protein KDJ14_16010 [Xanthomonadales bacterium]|nr:hypothetical protein [Xanthomonadales bacterium]